MPGSHSRYAVFLSHDSRDKQLIEALANKLRNAGLHPWFDKWELIPGNRWIGGLAEGINSSGTCAIFIGSEVLSNWERQELEFAQIRAARDASFRLIPVLLPGLPSPFDVNTLPPFLIGHTWVDFRRGIEDSDAFHHLQSGITGVAPRSTSRSEAGPKYEQNACPYRGLQAFTEDDRQFYFGRDFDIQRLVEKLKRTRLLGVLGPSGSGKSSLVRAGLIPRLKEGELLGSEKWRIAPVFSPGPSPLDALVLNLAEAFGCANAGLLELLRDNEHALHTAVRNFLDSSVQRTGETRRVLLVVDQLEEIFTLCANETDRSQFLANLHYAGSIPGGGCLVIVIMRADFYQKCAAYPQFSSALDAEQLLVGAMQREGLVQAIQEPARVARAYLERGLVETIVDDVSSEPGALPLLEHALLELWERRTPDGQLTLEGYLDTGRVQGAIAKRADTIYKSLTEREQIAMKRIMLRLTRLGEGTEDTRRPAYIEELVTRSEDRETVERLISLLTRSDNRLLTADDRMGLTLEVSHEAVIRGWDRLRTWLNEDREGERLREKISEAAKEWGSQTSPGSTDEGLLFRGLLLARAVEWRKQHPGRLNELERKFLDASEALAKQIENEKKVREQKELDTARRLNTAERRARTRLLYLTAALFALALSVTLLSFRNYVQANRDMSRELTATANTFLSQDAGLSVKLANRALEFRSSDEANEVWKKAARKFGYKEKYQIQFDGIFWKPNAVISSAAFGSNDSEIVATGNDGTNWIVRVLERSDGNVMTRLNGEGSIEAAALSPDSKQIALAFKKGALFTTQMWEWFGGPKLVWEYSGNTRVNSLAFSPDGKILVIATADPTVQLHETASGGLIRPFAGHTEPLTGAAFSPDGQKLVTSSFDKTAIVWDIETGEKISLKGHDGYVMSAHFSNDGTKIITAGSDHTAIVWDAKSGKPLQKLPHDAAVNSAVFNVYGNLVLTATDHTVQLWDWTSGKSIQELRGHSDVITSAVFSADGTLALTASKDKTAIVWEVLANKATTATNCGLLVFHG